MFQKLKCKYLKFELILRTVNLRLPRLLRVTKVGFITTFIALLLATNIVFAEDDCSNLETWLGNQDCAAAVPKGSLVPGLIKTGLSIVAGHTEPIGEGSGGYVIKGSLLVAVNNMVVETYEETDQVSGVRYIASTLEDAGIIKPVQAATTGYGSFTPVLKVWRVMRNIALSFVIILGLILAVMILLRVRQGQGYVTILNTLPKLVITIILVLSSYSIAGALVDVGNVAEKLIISIFFNANFIDDIESGFYSEYDGDPDPDYPHNIYGGTKFRERDEGSEYKDYTEDYNKDFNVFRLLSRFTEFETWGEVPCDGRERPDWYNQYSNDQNMCPVGVADIIRTPTGIGTLDRGMSIIEELPADALLKLILTIVIITGVIKIFFSLVTSFVKMIIYTMFAPLVFLFFPVSPGVITTWLRYFLAASLMFPCAFLMMFLAAIIMGDPHAPWFTKATGVEIAGVAPDLLTYSTNVDAESNVPYLTRMMAIVLVMMIPTLPQFLMEVLKVPENIMVRGAKESFSKVASKVPFIGGMISGI